MAPAVEAAAAAEWALAGMALRAIFARECESSPDVVELRVSVVRDALPGLVVAEFELIDHAGMAVAGGTL